MNVSQSDQQRAAVLDKDDCAVDVGVAGHGARHIHIKGMNIKGMNPIDGVERQYIAELGLKAF